MTWPLESINQPNVNTDFATLPAFNSNGHQSSAYIDFIADSDKTSPTSTASNGTATLQHQQLNNTHIYPSLSGLAGNNHGKQIKPLPQSTMHTGYMQQNQPLSMPLHHIAPARSIPTPYIAADIAREPQMTTIPLLSRAPPADRLPPITQLAGDITEHHLLQHKSNGVSSLRSTMADDEKSEHSSEGRTEEEEAAMQLHRLHTQRDFTSPISYHRELPLDEQEEERITLPPIEQPDHRGSECHLPSLRSLLANDLGELPSRYEPRHRPSTSSATTASDVTEFITSPPSTSSPALSHSSYAQKRATPSRQFYPSLSSLAMRDEPASFASTSASSSSTGYHTYPHHHLGRPSTSDKLDRITHGVSTFRMDSYDEEIDDTKSESDDDMSPDAVYKRSRQRTRGPTPPPFSSGANSTHVTRSPSVMSEDDELASDNEEEDIKPVITMQAPTREQIMHRKRLAVIHALVARANALYREQMARKKHTPALIRVKEEELE